jgi:nitroreductase
MQYEEFADHLSRQRAIRAFDTSKEVDDATVEKLLRVATMAPSGGNRQPWRFIVIRDPAVKQPLARIYAHVSAAYSGGRPTSNTTPWEQVPVLIAVCTDNSSGGGVIEASIYPAVQNLLLAAHTLGLGSVLTTLWRSRESEVKQLLNLPDTMEIHAILPVGYPDRKYGRGKRRPVAEVAYRDRFGEPW